MASKMIQKILETGSKEQSSRDNDIPRFFHGYKIGKHEKYKTIGEAIYGILENYLLELCESTNEREIKEIVKERDDFIKSWTRGINKNEDKNFYLQEAKMQLDNKVINSEAHEGTTIDDLKMQFLYREIDGYLFAMDTAEKLVDGLFELKVSQRDNAMNNNLSGNQASQQGVTTNDALKDNFICDIFELAYNYDVKNNGLSPLSAMDILNLAIFRAQNLGVEDFENAAANKADYQSGVRAKHEGNLTQENLQEYSEKINNYKSPFEDDWLTHVAVAQELKELLASKTEENTFEQ